MNLAYVSIHAPDPSQGPTDLHRVSRNITWTCTRGENRPTIPTYFEFSLLDNLAKRRSMAGTLIISGFRTSHHTPCPARSSSYRLNSLLRGLHTHHVSCSPLHRYPKMVEAARRRIHGHSVDKGKEDSATAVGKCGHHGHDHEQSNSHSHSHGIFGGHSHSHGHDHDHAGLIKTLQSGSAHPPSSL